MCCWPSQELPEGALNAHMGLRSLQLLQAACGKQLLEQSSWVMAGSPPCDSQVNHCVCVYLQVFEVRAQWSRYALTQPETRAPEQGGRFNTTELHCTEYNPAVRWGMPAARVHSLHKRVCRM